MGMIKWVYKPKNKCRRSYTEGKKKEGLHKPWVSEGVHIPFTLYTVQGRRIEKRHSWPIYANQALEQK